MAASVAKNVRVCYVLLGGRFDVAVASTTVGGTS